MQLFSYDVKWYAEDFKKLVGYWLLINLEPGLVWKFGIPVEKSR